MANLVNQPTEKLMLEHYSENLTTQIDENIARSKDNYSYYEQTLETERDQEINDLSDDSILLHGDELDTADSRKMIEAFLFSGEPFREIETGFRRVYKPETLSVVPRDSDAQARRLDASLTSEVRSHLGIVSHFNSIKTQYRNIIDLLGG